MAEAETSDICYQSSYSWEKFSLNKKSGKNERKIFTILLYQNDPHALAGYNFIIEFCGLVSFKIYYFFWLMI